MRDLTYVSGSTIVRKRDEYLRSPTRMKLDLALGSSRGFSKYYISGKRFKYAKAMGEINNKKLTMRFDSGDEVCIINTSFARKVGCDIDQIQI